MPMVASTPSSPAVPAPLLTAFSAVHYTALRPFCLPTAATRVLSCQATLTAHVYSSFSPQAVISKEVDAACKIGARIRVRAKVKIFHVTKAPELDLCGMEGVIVQYVGVFKGKRVSVNLPYKVEFLLPVEGNEKPTKFVAHLREEELELL
ncbi:hypothetical protein KSP40_PGU009121 [Platanthera guangdongensis]|uniref:Ferredoxin thioredoxin reductase alpha chain domain-containing protein n=1 Tax=Platanthera guangdongensis TaxID=2320717 RepID=A0ABR2MTT5_9ASPA